MSHSILPGSTIGVLGGGQLGRMFAMAARRLGYRIHIFGPESNSPAGQVADREIVADYDDHQAVTAFADEVDVVTLEFENVPVSTCMWIEANCPVRPGHQILQVTQHRLREKTFLRDSGLPIGPYRAVNRAEDLLGAAELDAPKAVLKTAAGGYDGKGQQILGPGIDPLTAWELLGRQECILEAFIDFEAELSVIAARSVCGEVVCYDPVVNLHCNQILDTSISPSNLPNRVLEDAKQIARAVVESLDLVGVLCVEFFLTRQGVLLINELAPRPHNSGHLSIEAHETSQFEQQVRAVCGLPLGSTRQLRPSVMVNLLGDRWEDGQPAWEEVLELPGVHLHVYGKKEAVPGRKMGHLTALANTPELAWQLAQQAQRSLRHRPIKASRESALA